MNSEIMIVVDIECKTQHYDTVLDAIYKCARDSVLEKGCKRYDVYPDLNRSKNITLIEMWSDLGTLEQHKTLPHYLDLQTSLEDKVNAVNIRTARTF